MNAYPSGEQKLAVSGLHFHNDSVLSVFLSACDGSAVAPFVPGQYLSLRFVMDGRPVTRPYSICSSPADLCCYELVIERVPDGLVTPWLFSHVFVGMEICASLPQGNRVCSGSSILAFAGGTGITPYLSMARAIQDGFCSFDLTILYGVRDRSSALYLEELESMAGVSVVCLQDVLGQTMSRSVIAASYVPGMVLMTCGPAGMVDFVQREAASLGLSIVRELSGEVHVPDADYEDGLVRISVDGQSVCGSCRETVLTALEKAGIAHPANCRSGECGWCRRKLVSGAVYPDPDSGSICLCKSFPLSDLVLE